MTDKLTKWDKIEEEHEDNEQRVIHKDPDEVLSALVSTVNKLVDEVIELRQRK